MILRASAAILFSSTILASAGASAQDSANGLETIFVTAQKRQQSAQDIPISINAVGGDTLLKA